MATKPTHFTPELFKFLRALERNNDRDWFNASKDRYVEQVRDPLLRFIEDFAPKLGRISRHLIADPRPTGGSMFRIYRDVRFSKDKKPYKTVASAQFRHEAARDAHTPGFYLHLGAREVFMGAGVWHPDRDALGAIRDSIVERSTAWKRVKSSAGFKSGTVRLAGESLKRAPRGYDAEHPLVEDLKRKDFIVVCDLDEKTACKPGFIDVFTDRCKAATPLMRFITTSLDVPW